MAMGGGGSTYRSADGIWHAAIDIEPDSHRRRRRLTAQGKTKAVANARLRMKLDAYVRKGFTPNSPSPRLMDWLEIGTTSGPRQPASEQQAKLRERHRAAEQDSRREAHQLAGP